MLRTSPTGTLTTRFWGAFTRSATVNPLPSSLLSRKNRYAVVVGLECAAAWSLHASKQVGRDHRWTAVRQPPEDMVAIGNRLIVPGGGDHVDRNIRDTDLSGTSQPSGEVGDSSTY